jgi:hypothetical protein
MIKCSIHGLKKMEQNVQNKNLKLKLLLSILNIEDYKFY